MEFPVVPASWRSQFFQQRKPLILWVGVTLLALQLGFLTFSPARALLIVQQAGYTVMLLTFAWWVGLLSKQMPWRDLSLRWRQGGWKILLLIVGLSGFLHLQESYGFKVVNDELVQLSTSQRMHLTREAHMVNRGHELGTNFVPMQGSVDKRPLFYPFLLSLVHDLTSYRPENVFVLNALLTPVLFGLLYLVVSRVRGPTMGVSAVVLLATIPLLTQAATGGGFEILNLVMILATVYLGMLYAAKPTAASLGAFCLSGILLAQVRYESVLFVLPVAAVILWVMWRNGRLLLPWTLLLAPLLLVLFPLQYNIFKVRPSLWQLDDRMSEHGVYSLAYFYENVGRALSYFFEWDRSQANSHLVALCGLVGLGFFWMWLYRNHRVLRAEPARLVLVVFLLALCAQAVLMLCYFWGAYDDALTVRLSLPTQLLFVLVFAFIWPELVKPAWGGRACIGVAVFYLFVWTLPVLARRAYAHENLAAETSNWYRHSLHGAPKQKRLVVEPRLPLLWVVHGVPSIDYTILAERVEEFLYHYNRGTFEEYWVSQRMAVSDFSTGALSPISEHDLGSGVKLESVYQFQFSPTYYIRISRIVDLDKAAFREWAKASIEAQAAMADARPSAHSGISGEAEYIVEWLRNLP